MDEQPQLTPIEEEDVPEGRVVYSYPEDWKCPSCGATRMKVDREYAQCQGYGCKQWYKVGED